MGIWRSHHSIGNIAGSLIAGAFVEDSWGLSFAVPASIIFLLGILLFFFLVPDPRGVGCPVPDHTGKVESQKANDVLMVRKYTRENHSKGLITN